MIKIEHLYKTYHNKSGNVTALFDVNLELKGCGLILILGPSGSGKSTLLNIMAGNDKDYDGTFISDDKIVYMAQSERLFLDMSVSDNVKIITQDKEKADELLRYFGLEEFKDKRTKLLSNGQRKRLELLICLLLKAEVILIDEPTASLDHDNALKIMELLKDLSKTRMVIVVSHDLDLCKKYSDRVIYLEEGQIKYDEDKRKEIIAIKKENKIKRNLKDYFKLSLLDLRSRIAYYGLYLFLIVFISLVLLMLVNIFLSANKESNYLDTFKNGENIVESLPKTTVPNSDESYLSYDDLYGNYRYQSVKEPTYHFEDYDYFYLDDVTNTLDDKDLLAVSAFYSSMYRDSDQVINEITTYYEDDEDKAFYPLTHYDNLITKIPEYKKGEYNKIYHELFLINKSKYLKALESGIIKESTSYNLLSDAIRQKVRLYTLINPDENMPILKGQLPKAANEILIDQKTADILMKMYELEDMEMLLGKKVDIGVFSSFSKVKDLSFIWGYESEEDIDILEYLNDGDDPDMEVKRHYYETAKENTEDYNDYLPFECFEYEISGITTIENDNYALIFKGGSLMESKLWSYYVKDLSKLKFEYVSYIYKPGSDYSDKVMKLNASYKLENTDLILQSKLLKDEVAYKDLSSLMPYLFAILVIGLILIVALRLINIKRIKKESAGMSRALYAPYKYVLVKMLILYFANLFVIMITAYPLADLLNITELNVISVFGVSFLIMALALGIEMILAGIKYDQS